MFGLKRELRRIEKKASRMDKRAKLKPTERVLNFGRTTTRSRSRYAIVEDTSTGKTRMVYI